MVVNAVQDRGIVIRNWEGQNDPEVGKDMEFISFNGDGTDGQDLGHETFRFLISPEKEKTMRPRFDENGRIFDFCKTGWKPYDLAVTACLLVLRLHLGDDIALSSDGDMNGTAWAPAKELVRQLIRDEILTVPSTSVALAALDGEI